MVLAGIGFGYAVLRAGQLPAWAAIILIAGVILVASTQTMPGSVQLTAAGVRDLGFAGLGVALIRSAVRGPEPGEVETDGRSEALVGHAGSPKLIDANDVDGVDPGADEMPRTGFQNQAERAHHDRGFVGDGDFDLPALMDAANQAPEFAVGDAVSGPRVGVMQKPVS